MSLSPLNNQGMFVIMIVIFVCGGCAFCACCAWCILSSLGLAFYNNIISPFFKTSSQYSNSSHVTSPLEYQLVGIPVSGSLHASETEPILVEAYVLPPLANYERNRRDLVTNATANSISNGPKDIWAAGLFLVNIAVILYLFVSTSISVSNKSSDSLAPSDYETLNKLPIALFYMLILVIIVSTTSFWLLYMMMKNAKRMIDTVMWMTIAGFVFMATISLLTLQLFPAIICGIFGGINLYYYWSVRDRIPFASAVLSAACSAIKQNILGLLISSFGGLFFQLLWFLAWAIAMFGVRSSFQVTNDENGAKTNDDDQDSSLYGLAMFIMLISLYWGLQCIRDVVSVTSGGTVACWWFQPSNPNPVRGSLLRATTTSFGSICFGSLILATVTSLREVLRWTVQRSRRNRSRNFMLVCLLAVLEELLRILEGVISYINKYAYSYIAAYGYDFISAGENVVRLFERRGWSAIINDDLISNALWLYCLFLGILGTVLGAGASFCFALFQSKSSSSFSPDNNDLQQFLVVGVLSGGLIGLLIGSLIVALINSGVSMIYVCYAEDSTTLQVNHPEVHADLQSSWFAFNPDDARSAEDFLERGTVVAEPYYQPGYIHSSHNHNLQHSHQHLFATSVSTGNGSVNNPPPQNPMYRSYHA